VFVAVAEALGDEAMYSRDGINWRTGSTAKGYAWSSVTFGDGMFVTVSSTEAMDNVMTGMESSG
jgi:hypothetical protein